MTTRLETERMLLREFTTEDSQLLFELNNDPEVMFYINAGQPVRMAEIVEETLPAFLAYYREGDRFGFWAAIEKATGNFLGWFHYRPGDHSPDPELVVGRQPRSRRPEKRDWPPPGASRRNR
ncbi:MAG: GNAT family N-acetyltransferase [Actinobacteria bacterium]|nr:GNAT family N-acetyltransferase [Actinomycetota bacterium]